MMLASVDQRVDSENHLILRRLGEIIAATVIPERIVIGILSLIAIVIHV